MRTRRLLANRWTSISTALPPSALALLAACSSGGSGTQGTPTPDPPGVDTSHSVVQEGARVDIAYAESSAPLRDSVALANARARDDEGEDEDKELVDDHPVGKIRPFPMRGLLPAFDPIVQSSLPLSSMPVVGLNFLSQGNTLDPSTEGGTPPDTNGAVGPNHFVQAVNTGLAIWDKAGHVVLASRKFNALWTGYVGTNKGNSCATNDDGDPVVVYDQLADRWFISQFSLPNGNGGPNFQCVAVSKTPDPTGAYWLYDFQYPGLNDYGKFGIWPDAYYATFNMFNSNNGDADFCAYDRVSMLAGKPATQQCFQQGDTVSGALPVSLDGPIPPPRGEPGYFMQISDNQSLDLFKIHVDWTTPSKSTVTGPTNLKVTAFSPMCGQSGTCVPQPSPGNQLDSLSDRLMFRLTYRNFGTHEALMVNHAVDVTGQGGGIRWYEIRSPNGTPVVYQQGTYAPNDGSYRWMASLAQDQAEDMVLGFSIASAKQFPSIGWTGRLPSDPVGTMGQGESVIDTGKGVETGNFSDGTPATRWGDYSNITLDPTDDCTFWYTQELYSATGKSPRTWDTDVATVKFPSCALNDFALSLSPNTQSVPPGGKVTYSLTMPKTKGTAETIALAIQDLPTGLTAAFSPASAPAGTPVTLTVTAASNAAVTTAPVLFTVIGKAPSAVHAASANVVVGGTLPSSDAGVDAGPLPDAGIPPVLDAGIDSGLHTDAGIPPLQDAGSGDSSTSSDASGADDANVPADAESPEDASVDSASPVDAAPPPPDAGELADAQPIQPPHDSGAPPGNLDAGSNDDAGSNGGAGSSSGCGCRTAGSSEGTSSLGFGTLALVAFLPLRRRRRRA